MTNRIPSEKLSACLDGELTAEEEAEVLRAVAECGESQREFDELKQTINAIRDLPPVEPPPEFPSRVMRVAERDTLLSGTAQVSENGQRLASPPMRYQRRWVGLQIGTVAITSVAALLVAVSFMMPDDVPNNAASNPPGSPDENQFADIDENNRRTNGETIVQRSGVRNETPGEVETNGRLGKSGDQSSEHNHQLADNSFADDHPNGTTVAEQPRPSALESLEDMPKSMQSQAGIPRGAAGEKQEQEEKNQPVISKFSEPQSENSPALVLPNTNQTGPQDKTVTMKAPEGISESERFIEKKRRETGQQQLATGRQTLDVVRIEVRNTSSGLQHLQELLAAHQIDVQTSGLQALRYAETSDNSKPLADATGQSTLQSERVNDGLAVLVETSEGRYMQILERLKAHPQMTSVVLDDPVEMTEMDESSIDELKELREEEAGNVTSIERAGLAADDTEKSSTTWDIESNSSGAKSENASQPDEATTDPNMVAGPVRRKDKLDTRPKASNFKSTVSNNAIPPAAPTKDGRQMEPEKSGGRLFSGNGGGFGGGANLPASNNNITKTDVEDFKAAKNQFDKFGPARGVTQTAPAANTLRGRARVFSLAPSQPKTADDKPDHDVKMAEDDYSSAEWDVLEEISRRLQVQLSRHKLADKREAGESTDTGNSKTISLANEKLAHREFMRRGDDISDSNENRTTEPANAPRPGQQKAGKANDPVMRQAPKSRNNAAPTKRRVIFILTSSQRAEPAAKSSTLPDDDDQ